MSPKEVQNTPKPREKSPAAQLPCPQHEPEQELYLEHLMNMMVNVMDRGFQNSSTSS